MTHDERSVTYPMDGHYPPDARGLGDSYSFSPTEMKTQPHDFHPEWSSSSSSNIPVLPSIHAPDEQTERPRLPLLSSILDTVPPPPPQSDRYAPMTRQPGVPSFLSTSPPQPMPSDSPLSHTSNFPIYPHNPNNPFDAILPRGLLFHIVDLYFDYMYGLCPFIHRPSFMRDLREHREEQPDSEEFQALVLGLVSCTLSQIPRAFVPLPRSEVKGLLIKTFQWVQRYLNQLPKELTVTRRE
jgi:hypothetical protein